MILTEKEAEGKNCCDGGAGKGEQKRYLCIHSQCMAWRWDKDEPNERPPRGYCGLAGAPR